MLKAKIHCRRFDFFFSQNARIDMKNFTYRLKSSEN